MLDIVPLTTHYRSGTPRISEQFIPNKLTEWVIKYQKTGSLVAKNKAAEAVTEFIRSNAHRIAKAVTDDGRNSVDLECAGWSGFMEALARYDPVKGCQFLTFAVRRIRGAMLDERRKYFPAFYRRKRNVEDDVTHDRDAQKYKNTLSFDEMYGASSDDSDSTLSLLDISLSTPSHLETIIAQDEENDTWKIVNRMLTRLDYRERYALLQYFLYERTLKSIGSDLGVSESYASLLKKRALKKIHQHFSKTPLPIRKKNKRQTP